MARTESGEAQPHEEDPSQPGHQRAALSCSAPVVILALVPAVPMYITAKTERNIVARHRGFDRVLRAERACEISPLEVTQLRLLGTRDQLARCTLDFDVAQAGLIDSVVHKLAQQVFLEPERLWTAASFAQTMRTTPERVQRSLFARGMAFTSICRTQRLMRMLRDAVLGDLAQSDIAERYGWQTASDAASLFYDHFGITITAARGLAANRSKTGPG